MPNLPKNSHHSLFNIHIYSFFPCASHYPLKQLAADWSFSQCIWNGNYAYAALFQRKTGSQPGMKSKCQRHLLPLIYLINSSEPVAQFINRLKTRIYLSLYCHAAFVISIIDLKTRWHRLGPKSSKSWSFDSRLWSRQCNCRQQQIEYPFGSGISGPPNGFCGGKSTESA